MQELVTVLVTLAAFHFGSGASAGVRRGGDILVALHGGRWRTTANRVHVIEGLVRVAPGEGSNPSSDTSDQAKRETRSNACSDHQVWSHSWSQSTVLDADGEPSSYRAKIT